TWRPGHREARWERVSSGLAVRRHLPTTPRPDVHRRGRLGPSSTVTAGAPDSAITPGPPRKVHGLRGVGPSTGSRERNPVPERAVLTDPRPERDSVKVRRSRKTTDRAA